MDAIIKAIESGDVEKVRDALGDEDPNQMDPQSGESPLAMAADAGQLAVVEFLLAAGADPNDAGTTLSPLSAAAGQGYVEIVEALLSADADVDVVDEDGGTPLGDAAGGGHLQVVQMLLESGANPEHRDRSGTRPIAHAANQGHEEVVEALLPFATPADKRQVELILQLAKQGPTSDAGRKFLENAEAGRMDAVQAYLASGGDVNVLSSSGETALFGAARGGRADVLQLLIACGADVNHIDALGNTALNWAKEEAVINVLIVHTDESLVAAWKQDLRKALDKAASGGHMKPENIVLVRNKYKKYLEGGA